MVLQGLLPSLTDFLFPPDAGAPCFTDFLVPPDAGALPMLPTPATSRHTLSRTRHTTSFLDQEDEPIIGSYASILQEQLERSAGFMRSTGKKAAKLEADMRKLKKEVEFIQERGSQANVMARQIYINPRVNYDDTVLIDQLELRRKQLRDLFNEQENLMQENNQLKWAVRGCKAKKVKERAKNVAKMVGRGAVNATYATGRGAVGAAKAIKYGVKNPRKGARATGKANSNAASATAEKIRQKGKSKENYEDTA